MEYVFFLLLFFLFDLCFRLHFHTQKQINKNDECNKLPAMLFAFLALDYDFGVDVIVSLNSVNL